MRFGFGFGMSDQSVINAGRVPVNLIVGSTSDLTSGWKKDANLLVGSGIADPFGGNDATRLYCTVAAGGSQIYTWPTDMAFPDETFLCWSAYMKNSNTPLGTKIRLYSPVGALLFEVVVLFASPTSATMSSVTPNSTITDNDGGAGFAPAVDDWWRVWVYADVSVGSALTDFDYRFVPWLNSGLGTEEVFVAGPQINPGSAPDQFVPVVV